MKGVIYGSGEIAYSRPQAIAMATAYLRNHPEEEVVDVLRYNDLELWFSVAFENPENITNRIVVSREGF